MQVPQSYSQLRLPANPKLEPLLPMNDAIVDVNHTKMVKQRHTVIRLIQRLRDEHGSAGDHTVVRMTHFFLY